MLTPLISSLLLAMAIGVPIAFALGIAGTIGLIVLDPSTLVLVPQRIFSGVDSFPLMAVPFFVLAGELMGTTGILKRLLALAETLVGHFRGGLAHVNVAGSMVFAGISGSAIADASALGSALIPSMAQRYKIAILLPRFAPRPLPSDPSFRPAFPWWSTRSWSGRSRSEHSFLPASSRES